MRLERVTDKLETALSYRYMEGFTVEHVECHRW